MKTVLLATDHAPPDPAALDYALVLCKRLAARLEVLHILQASPTGSNDGRPGGAHHPGRRPPTHIAGDDQAPVNAHRAVSAAPARIEAVDQHCQLHSNHPTTQIDYRYEVAGEATDTILERYVQNHRNIVLTVFDSRSGLSPATVHDQLTRPAGKRAMPRLAVPLVRVKKTQ